VHELPGQVMASLVYRGEREYAPAYRAMRRWLEVSRAAVVGPKREIFLEGGDDAESVTEIQFPIGNAASVARPEGRPA
jgi:effector-binding domain-containing protein